MIKKIKKDVDELLKNDTSGHNIDHINRVLNLSLKFAKKEKANEEIVALISLLHEVDDYKLFGKEYSENLTNSKKIMNDNNIPMNIQKIVLEELKYIGYSKYLKGIRPKTIEGKIVSDSDMCDALGVNGFLRVYQFSKNNNMLFFDKNIFPNENIKYDEYIQKKGSGVNHIFEKILKLKDIMMTKEGKKEANKRHQIIIDMLYHLFEEENVPEWKNYLDKYLKTKK